MAGVNLDRAWLRLIVAVLLGGTVGVERELAGQPAGLRTHALVSLGAALFTIIGLGFFITPTEPGLPAGDVVRIVSAIATGIGFLGAGAIVRGGGTVQGLTTAASLWATAAIGLAVGSGFFLLATVSVALILLILRGFTWLKGLLPPERPEGGS